MILSLDLSLRQTGYAVIDKDEIITFGEIKTPINLRGVERLDFILQKIIQLLHEYIVEWVVIEGYAYNSYGSVPDLGELGGVVRYYLYKTNVPFLILTTTSLKKFILGKGNAPKEAMMPTIYKKYNIECGSSDSADAVGLAKIAYGVSLMMKGPLDGKKYLKYENDVLSAIWDGDNRLSTLKLQ